MAALAVAALFSTGAAAREGALRTGVYQVSYALELPHIERAGGGSAKICLTDAGGAQAFPVMSANNPLAGCPAKNLRRDGDELSFEIVCPGGGAAKAHALFVLRDGAFDGRIAMTMGGKNMTMTEIQHGERVGDCDAAAREKTPAAH